MSFSGYVGLTLAGMFVGNLIGILFASQTPFVQVNLGTQVLTCRRDIRACHNGWLIHRFREGRGRLSLKLVF